MYLLPVVCLSPPILPKSQNYLCDQTSKKGAFIQKKWRTTHFILINILRVLRRRQNNIKAVILVNIRYGAHAMERQVLRRRTLRKRCTPIPGCNKKEMSSRISTANLSQYIILIFTKIKICSRLCTYSSF